MATFWLLMVIALGVGFWWYGVGSKSSQLDHVVSVACADLEHAPVFQVTGVLQRAESEASDLGYSSGELGSRVRSQCPGSMAALDTPAPKQGVDKDITLKLDRCDSDEVMGTVTNNSGIQRAGGRQDRSARTSLETWSIPRTTRSTGWRRVRPGDGAHHRSRTRSFVATRSWTPRAWTDDRS